MPFPLDRKFIEYAEARLGLRLPAGYAGAMQRANGGQVSAGGDHWTLHPIRDDSSRKRTSRTCNDIVTETESSRGFPSFPNGALAIASNGTGDQLVLLRSDAATSETYGPQVYWWYHDSGELSLVADDFADLISA